MKLGKLLELIDLAKSGKKIVRCMETIHYGALNIYESYRFNEVNILEMDLDELVSTKDMTEMERVSEDRFERRGYKYNFTYGTYEEMKKLADEYNETIEPELPRL